jgi:hypothetical protein
MTSGMHRYYHPCQCLTLGNMGQIQLWPVLMFQGGLTKEIQTLPPLRSSRSYTLVTFGPQARDGTSKKSFTLTLKPLLVFYEIMHATTIGHLRWRYHRMF